MNPQPARAESRTATLRSYLYVPADRPDRLARSTGRGADALIVDLEDAVAPASKAEARGHAAAFLAGAGPTEVVEVWVRVNAIGSPYLADDVAAVTGPALCGICLPKCETVQDLVVLDQLLSAAEERSGLPVGSVQVSALVESARGLLGVADLATGARVDRLQLGEADLAADLGVEPGPEEEEFRTARFQLVLVSAAGGLAAPIGPVSRDFTDLERLRRTTEGLRRLGYGGRAAIHPAQVAVINQVFTPSHDEAVHAREVVAHYQEALEAGVGAVRDGDGTMIDEAVVRSARRILDRVALAGRSEPGGGQVERAG